MGGIVSMTDEKKEGSKSAVVDDVPASSSSMESNNSSGSILKDTLSTNSKDVVVDAPLSEDLFDHNSDDEDMPGLNDYSDDEDTLTAHQPPNADVDPANTVTTNNDSGASTVEEQPVPSTAQQATGSYDQEDLDLEGFYFLLTYVLRRSYGQAAARARTAASVHL
ncbi:hypothetical protein CPC08DRAFT_755161 [Agrocybe pediades]|nr:hypothetical protein CPC08DRAFT_755161 [Agrocybe pediades]